MSLESENSEAPLPIARRTVESDRARSAKKNLENQSGESCESAVLGDVEDSDSTELVGGCRDRDFDLADAPLTHYSSRSAICNPVQLLRDMYQDTLAGRELAWRLFVRNIRGLYRQTFLGLFWAFLPPIANTAFWLFLSRAKVFSTGDLVVHPAIYILTGMIFWQAFIDSFQMPLNMFNKSKNMISKLNFPRESLLLVGVGEVCFDLLIRLLLLVPAFWLFGVTPPISLLLVPLALIPLILVGCSLGLLLLPIGSLYQDVGRLISIAMPFWMILTPVIYPPILDFPFSLLNWINPASPLIIVARDWTLFGATAYGVAGWCYGLASVPLFLIGLIVYRVSIPVLVERMNA